MNDAAGCLITEIKKIVTDTKSIDEDEIRKAFRLAHYEKGQCFIREGEIPRQLGFITKGLMKYYYIDAEGNEWIKHFSADNEFVASYGSFLYQCPSLYYIEAIEETTLLTISYDLYSQSIHQSLVWCTIARKYTEKIYYEKEKREASFLKNNGTQRYLDFLTEHPQLANRINIKDIASFLGLSQVSLSRIRKSLHTRAGIST